LKKRKRLRLVIVGAISLMMATPFNVMAIGPQQQKAQSDLIQNIHSKVLDQVKAFGKQETVFIEESLDTKTTTLLSVIVELKESREQGIGSKTIKAQQNSFIQTLNNQGLDITVGRTFQKVFNGMAMTIPGNKIAEVAANPNVKAIYEDGVVMATPVYSQDASDGAPYIGAHEMNAAGFSGQGMKVGVIDTGIDYLHPDLKDAFKGGYDFVDNDEDPYETKPSRWTQETTHGTHVSGTIVGKNISGHGVRGVAPEADLYVYRVLGSGGSGSDSNVMAGIEKSVEDDMDVINLSLGSGVQHDPFSPTAIAVNNAILAGVTVVLSNGNEGARGRYSVGSPASSDMAISVGASTLPSTRYTGDVTISYPNPSTTVETQQTKINTKFPVKVMAWDEKDGPEGYAKNLQGVPLVYVGEGASTDYKSHVKGKAVLITRGDVTFDEKIRSAKNAGAVAAFIFDKDSISKGPITYFLGAGDYVATYSLSEESGVELLNAVKAHPEEEFTLDFGAFQSVSIQGDEVAPFSSRGPTVNSNIKPDVVAPGVNIRSSVAAYGGNYSDAYQAMNGTSMAAPNVTGLAVLLKQAHPEYSPFDVKAALMNTAKVLETPKYTMFDQGAGRVQGLNALKTDALVMVKEQSKSDNNHDQRLELADHYTGSVLFGKMASSETDAITQKKTVLLKDVAGKAQDYTVRYQFTGPENTNNVTVTTPVNVHVDANGETNFDVSINVPAGTPTGEYQGNIYLTNVVSGTELHLPFVSFIGDTEMGEGFTHIEVKNPGFSPDGDGVRDTIPIKFGLYNKTEVVFGELFDKNGGYLGVAFEYVAQTDHPVLEAGEHTIEWDGTYFYGNEIMQAPDGVYTIALIGFSKIPQSDTDMPFIKWIESDLYLQTQMPKVEVKNSDFIGETETYHLSGKVKDEYSSNGEGEKVKVFYTLRNLRANGMEAVDSGFFFANSDGTFGHDIKVFPGYNIIYVFASTPAFDFGGGMGPNNGSYMHLRVGEPTQYFVNPDRDIKLGEEFEVTIDARYVKNFIGGDLGFMVDESSMKFLGAEATAEVKAYGDVSIVVKDLGESEPPVTFPIIGPGPGPGPGPGDDFPPVIMHGYKVGLALKGKTNGINGNIRYLKLKFKATSNIEKVNQTYPIVVTESSIVNLDPNGKEELTGTFAVDGTIILNAPNQKISGHVNNLSPEAFESGADFSKKGIKVYASWGGYLDRNNEYHNGITVEGVVNPDGTFVIDDLPADQTFTVRLFVPGHLPAVMDYLQLISNEDGIYVPGDVEVQWSNIMLAGNVNQDNYINILDLAIVSRNFGTTNATAELGDINLDGAIDILDLSYVTANYDKYNENSLMSDISIPIPQRPIN
jgi:minor extracellular serine protease Vpr